MSAHVCDMCGRQQPWPASLAALRQFTFASPVMQTGADADPDQIDILLFSGERDAHRKPNEKDGAEYDADNNQMDLLAARMGTSIHYCHPYTPTQKAKIERWFRTLRDKWLSTVDLSSFKNIDLVQKSLDDFVLDYNKTIHSSLNGKSPEERFFSESSRIHRLKEENCDKIFLLEITRRVSVDCVISVDNVEYEVDSKYAGRRITLRYSPDMSDIYVVEADGILTPVRLLNKQENAEVKRNKVYLSGGDF